MTARIGLIIPSSNRMVEEEMARHVPPGVTAHVARLRMTGAHRVGLDALLPQVKETAATLTDARCDVVAFHCTANSTSEGVAGEAKLLGALRDAGATHVTTTASAIRHAFDVLGARRIVLLTPYSAHVTEEEAGFLREAGHEVVHARGFAMKGSDEYCATPPQFWRDRAFEAARPDADAYFLSCANISVFPVIEEIEQKLGRPVVTSNQAVIWEALSLLGIADRRNCRGRLFDSLVPKIPPPPAYPHEQTMTSQQNTDRIQTTHIGSLPRPHALLDVMKAKYAGKPYDQAAYAAMLAEAVEDTVRKQAECGIDIVTDGEFSKPGFFTYIQERLEGFERRPDQKMKLFQQEVAAFPEYYAEYFKQAMMGGAIVGLAPVVCVAPVKYRGEKLVQTDIDNVKKAAAAAGVPDHHVFLPATAPSGVGINEYYKSDEEYFHALAAELGKEYRAIVDAGILVQIDDPFLPDIFFEPDLDRAQMRRRAEIYVEATNTALKGIPPEMVRFHTCYGINEGPRLYEAALADIIDYVLKINAGSYSFEAANPRHEHEYHLFERVKLGDGKVICPGMITHASNIVEHPELIAERIVRFAKLVGRENVIAAADCGFSSQALYRTEVHPTVVWEKFKALRQGADLATKMLWK